jgi:DNA helicase-2/ATP-dependent DNA helicase PcrA
VPRGDPQPNPKDRPGEVHIRLEPNTPADEIETITRSAKAWVEDHPEETVAILVPKNDRGSEFVQALQKQGVAVVELLRSSTSARQIAGSLTLILEHLAHSVDPARLARSFEVWRRDEREDADQKAYVKRVAGLLGKAVQVETFLYPVPDQDWLDRGPQVVEVVDSDPAIRDQLEGFRATVRRWQAAVNLPVDQLVLTLAQDLFRDPLDLAIAYSIAVALRQEAEAHPDWRLPDFAGYLRSVARNERSAAFLTENEPVFDPDAHKGKVTVATMHKAKGLEWDRVYLTSVNNYDFPSDEAHDSYMSETWYVRDQLNLHAEARGQLQAAAREIDAYIEGQASRDARLDYVAERLRLLYVGITRARKELVITWNTGRNGDKVAATPLIALHHFWEKQRS